MLDFIGQNTIGTALAAIGIASLCYTWLGYPLAVFLLKTFASRPLKHASHTNDESPKVTILLTVRNEARIIRERIQNFLALHYPNRAIA